HVTPLLKGKGTKEANAKTMLYLEDFKLQPGDLVTMYATARDVSKTAQSDIIFAQAEPFDFSFRQSQAMGGGGGEGQGGDEAQEIAERQKEIIAATWNQVKDGDKNRALIGQNARFLAEMQNKLSDQAKTLAERMGSRELVGASPQFEQFSKIMTEASSEMQRAVDQLRPARWHNALPPEQKALQDLLRADSMFRDIQVAFGHHGGGGGRGSMGAQQDLARMLDLELDMSKNQYETEQSPMAGSGNQQKQLDDALQKLKDLARRQQELAQQRAQQQTFHQRWEQEQLRREAEQLRQQMQQLSRNQEASESQSERSQMGQQSASGQQQSQSGQESQSGEATQLGQRGVSEAGRQAMQAIETAEEEMRRAVSDHDATAQRRAEEQLSEAQKSLQRALEQQAGNSLADLARRAQQLSQHQSDLANRVKRQYGAEGVNTAENDAQAGTGMPEMKGPGYAGGGYWRHRLIPEPIRPSTPQERALAVEGDKLADQVKQLQREVEQQARDLAAEQPNAVSKLRKALSDAEQQELALRMQKNSEWLRNGYGDQTWAMEDSITAGMQQLSRQLQQAQRALGQGNSPAQNDALARALDEARGLRAQIAAGSPTIGGGTREAMDDFAMLGRNDRSLREYTNGAIEYLQHVQGQDGLLDARISANAARSLERLEAELERRLGEQGSSSARTGAREDAPEAYRDAVAEYFRRLSK
ncbi:MAG: hypothetical protein JO061_12945, partial [Acidobacteriaceae bacterium]|nr:hypothetical protein [Acidobacteriaceae bacterium]